jgi:hypothetical protein
MSCVCMIIYPDYVRDEACVVFQGICQDSRFMLRPPYIYSKGARGQGGL